MKSTGRHLLAEYWGCNAGILDDKECVESLLRASAEKAGATVVASVFHTFSPHGVTGVVVVEESHLSIHTWPEHGYAAVDFFTCGDCTPEQAFPFLETALEAEYAESMMVHRGMGPAAPSMSVDAHRPASELAEFLNG